MDADERVNGKDVAFVIRGPRDVLEKLLGPIRDAAAQQGGAISVSDIRADENWLLESAFTEKERETLKKPTGRTGYIR